jgi:hypothetical protein
VNWQLGKVLAAMQVSFPELTVIRLSSHDETLSAIPVRVPDSFLGGSASATLRIVWHSISGIAKATFVCDSPCLPSAFQYSSFRVHFT